MKSRQVTAAQQSRIDSLAESFGMRPQDVVALALDAGLSVLERKVGENGQQPLAAISQQQRVVLELLQQGKTVKEIAYQLGLGEATIRTHITRIKDKLNCNDLLNLRMNGVFHPAE